jgi:hypothetical protein
MEMQVANLSAMQRIYPTLSEGEREQFLHAMTSTFDVTAEDITAPNPEGFKVMYAVLPDRDQHKIGMLVDGLAQIEMDKKRLFFDIELLHLKGRESITLWVLQPDDPQPDRTRIIHEAGDVRVALRVS